MQYTGIIILKHDQEVYTMLRTLNETINKWRNALVCYIESLLLLIIINVINAVFLVPRQSSTTYLVKIPP